MTAPGSFIIFPCPAASKDGSYSLSFSALCNDISLLHVAIPLETEKNFICPETMASSRLKASPTIRALFHTSRNDMEPGVCPGVIIARSDPTRSPSSNKTSGTVFTFLGTPPLSVYSVHPFVTRISF